MMMSSSENDHMIQDQDDSHDDDDHFDLEQQHQLSSESFHENESIPGEGEDEQRRKILHSRIKKGIVALVLIGFIVFVIVDSTTNGYIRNGIESFLEWIEDNPAAGAFVFSLVYCLATILFVPGLILTLGAGFVFGNAFGLGAGLVIATISVFVGASAGAIASFLLGRYLLRSWVEGLTKKYAIFEALDVAFEEKGLRIMTLLRLSPVIPFNVVNYLVGVTAISLRDYCLSLLAILPGTVLYVFVGSSAGSLTGSADSNISPALSIGIIAVGIVFGVFAVVMTSFYAKRELRKVVAAREAEKEAERIEEEAERTATDTEESGTSIELTTCEEEDVEHAVDANSQS